MFIALLVFTNLANGNLVDFDDKVDNPATRADNIAKWTIMVYMAADNNLEYFGIEDLNEMEMIGSSEDINIIVQFDRHPDGNVNNGYSKSNGDWYDTRRFLVQRDEDAEKFYDYEVNQTMWELGEVAMSDKNTFEEFLHWGIGNYTAEHYLLVLWDHGEGIMSHSRGSNNDYFSNKKTNTRGICSDETDGGWLDLWEMRAAFSKIKDYYDFTFDIISFDICWIGTVETAYELGPYADYMTGSPEEEPNPGWNYQRPLNYLAENPGVSPREFAIRISTDFKQEYRIEKHLEWKYLTYTTIDLNRFEKNAIPKLNNFARTMADSIFDNYQVINNARSNTMYPHNKGYMRDIFHFAKLIKEDQTATKELQSAAKEFYDEYSKTILEYVHGSLQPNGLGPTIYFPARDFNSEYKSKLLFSTEYWDDFIKLYLTPIQIEHTPLNDTESITDPIQITAKIKGFNLDKNNIYIFFKDDKMETKSPIKMEKSGSGVEHEFTAKLNLENLNTNVHYFIRTQENTVGVTYIYSPQELNEGNIDTWYTFYAGKDLQKPAIEHEPGRDIDGTLGEPYIFYANITDNLGLDPNSLYFHYNKNNSEEFNHQPLEIAELPNRCKTTIPIQEKGTIIYYYFTAIDNAEDNNSARYPEVGVLEFNVSRVKPEASIYVDRYEAFSYESLKFISTSKPELTITTYTWDFGDGSELAKGKEISYFYIQPGEYTVTLKVVDENGLWDTASIEILIKNSPPIVHIETDPILVNGQERTLDDNFYINGTVYENDEILLDCTSSDDLDGYIQVWSWRFGDGNRYSELWTDWNSDGRFDFDYDKVIPQTEMSKTEQEQRLNSTKKGSLTYKYTKAGDYKIRFSGEDNYGQLSEVLFIYVKVENKKPVPKPGIIEIDGLDVEFTPHSIGLEYIDTPSDLESLNFTWDFGDGHISYDIYPNHTYTSKGQYIVTLTVRDDDRDSVVEKLELDLEDKPEGGNTNLLLSILIVLVIVILIILFTIARYRSDRTEPETEQKTKVVVDRERPVKSKSSIRSKDTSFSIRTKDHTMSSSKKGSRGGTSKPPQKLGITRTDIRSRNRKTGTLAAETKDVDNMKKTTLRGRGGVLPRTSTIDIKQNQEPSSIRVKDIMSIIQNSK